MIPPDERYHLTILKSLPEEQLTIPEIGNQIFYHLDRDYEECERFYAVSLERQESWISFVLIRQWDWEVGNINEPIFEMLATKEDDETRYMFTFNDVEITLYDLQDDFVIADSFQPLELFDMDATANVMTQLRWFLALCGTFPYIYDYIGR